MLPMRQTSRYDLSSRIGAVNHYGTYAFKAGLKGISAGVRLCRP